MHQAVGQLAIVSEQQQTFGLGIQPADMEEALPLLEADVDEIAHGGAAQFILHGGVHTTWLVQDEIHGFIVDLYAGAIHADHVCDGVDAHAHLLDNFAIDFHTACGDELLAHAAAGHSCSGENLLQADFFLRGGFGGFGQFSLSDVLTFGRLGLGQEDFRVLGLFLRCAVSASGGVHL